jgi:hypothetical protein
MLELGITPYIPDTPIGPVAICDHFGISRTTLFKYEASGTITGVERNKKGNREYPLETVQQIGEIVRERLGASIAGRTNHDGNALLITPVEAERLFLTEIYTPPDAAHGLQQMQALASVVPLSDQTLQMLTSSALPLPRDDFFRHEVWNIAYTSDATAIRLTNTE